MAGSVGEAAQGAVRPANAGASWERKQFATAGYNQ